MRKESKKGKENLSDEELMELYQSSDYIAFEILYHRHSGCFYQYLNAKVGNELAQELLQDTFARIHKSRDKYITQFPFVPWAFTIVRNLLRDHYKLAETRRVQKSVSMESVFMEAAPETVDTNSLNQLEVSMGSLPATQQKALRLRYLSDWSFLKIAEEIESSPQNVRQLISRGLKKIRSSFNSQGEKGE